MKFAPKNPNTLLSCSADGTVRAYDTKRYKNFRIMKPNTSVQFSSLAVDPSGEVIIYEYYSKNLNY